METAARRMAQGPARTDTRVVRLEPGTRLGAYEIVSLLGVGGMGEVYRARDTRLERDVALKVLPDPFAEDPMRLTRLERAAKALASLNHPHIATLYGVEDTDRAPVLVMELVEGETLSDRLRRKRLSLAEALELARQMAEGLEAAHEKGILHRDPRFFTNAAPFSAPPSCGCTDKTMRRRRASEWPTRSRRTRWCSGCTHFEGAAGRAAGTAALLG